MIVSLEGLPGAGKSTTARLLAQWQGWDAVAEATRDHPFLDSIYAESGRHDLQVELGFLVLHFGGWRTITPGRDTVCDFAPGKDLLFADDMLRGNDRELFESVYQRFYSDQPQPDVVVYLDVPVEECLARARRRGRPYEAGMDAERLTRMQQLYETAIASSSLGKHTISLAVSAGDDEDRVADGVLSALGIQRRAPAAA